MEAEDWEVLHHNSESDSDHSPADVAESDFKAIIQNNYFSLHSPNNLVVTHHSHVSSNNSDNPSWVDPASQTQCPINHSAESEFLRNSDVGFLYNHQNGRFQEDVSTENDENLGEFLPDSSIDSGEMMGDDLGMEKDAILGEESGNEEKSVEEKRKISGVLWWKFPVELLRYFVFRGPVWTVSVAAAFMGFVILGRRLYKMKKKSRALGDRVAMDDKKISQFMTRAARLNEAFSVVKRVPIIRPSLPAVGVTPWPMASLR